VLGGLTTTAAPHAASTRPPHAVDMRSAASVATSISHDETSTPQEGLAPLSRARVYGHGEVRGEGYLHLACRVLLYPPPVLWPTREESYFYY
jgi:hypothetical protein